MSTPEEFIKDYEQQQQLVNLLASPFNSQNNTRSIILLSEGRKKYKDQSINRILEIAKSYNIDNLPFGDLLEQNALYGILDSDNDVILPKNEYIVKGQNNAQLQDFCNLALKEMSVYLQDAKLCGKIKTGNKYENFTITKSYTDISNIYLLFQANIATGFKNLILRLKNENSQIVDHKSFIKKYIQFLFAAGNSYTLTKSHTILSANLLQYTSGMMFSIDTADAGDDIKKYEEYLLSPNFLVFADACKRFGFKIDKNMPWVLYADLGSPAMLGTTGNHTGYLTRYGINNVKDVFEKRFYKVYAQDLTELKQSFYNAYNIFLSDGNEYYRESDSKLCSRDAQKMTIYKRKSVTIEEFFVDFPDTFWMRLYIYFRNMETGKGLTQIEFDNLSNEAGKYIKLGLLNEALIYTNQYFKDFNYINYVSSLQPKKEMLELQVSNVSKPKLVF